MNNRQLSFDGSMCHDIANSIINELKPIIEAVIRKEFEKLQSDNVNEIPIHKEKRGMASIEPNCKDAERYSTTQTCQLLGLSYKTVIKYTNSGDLVCGFRKLQKDKQADNSRMKKFYTGSAIKKFWRSRY